MTPHEVDFRSGGASMVVGFLTLSFGSLWGSLLFPVRRWILPISLLATAGTCLLEFMQLWQPSWLMQLRATRIGAALLGSGFSWSDFPPYFIGGVIGFLGLSLVYRLAASPSQITEGETN